MYKYAYVHDDDSETGKEVRQDRNWSMVSASPTRQGDDKGTGVLHILVSSFSASITFFITSHHSHSFSVSSSCCGASFGVFCLLHVSPRSSKGTRLSRSLLFFSDRGSIGLLTADVPKAMIAHLIDFAAFSLAGGGSLIVRLHLSFLRGLLAPPLVGLGEEHVCWRLVSSFHTRYAE